MINKDDLAPIILFVYNRHETTKVTVESLKKNSLAIESDLYIFSDGAKNAENEEKVKKVREYIKTIDGFKSVTIVERDRNYGLAESVITGITEVINKHGKMIAIEDDLQCSPYILDYFNSALQFYKNKQKVYTITGYSFPIFDRSLKIDHTYFLSLMNPWSWATWADRWAKFDQKAEGWEAVKSDKDLRLRFNFYKTYDYSKALELQMTKGIQSWAIRWYWTIFKNDGLNLYPFRTLARNIGFDGSGTHDVFITDSYDVLCEEKFDYNFPTEIYEKELSKNIVVTERIKRKILSLKDAKRKAFLSITGASEEVG